MRQLFMQLLFASALLAGLQAAAGDEPIFSAVVRDVVRGNYLEVEHEDGKTTTVVLHGIECPPSYDTIGREARDFVSRLVEGQRLSFEIEPMQTAEIRHVVAQLPDGRNLNEVLLSRGYARWLRNAAPDNETYRQLEAQAREANRGLWGGRELTKGAEYVTESEASEQDLATQMLEASQKRLERRREEWEQMSPEERERIRKAQQETRAAFEQYLQDRRYQAFLEELRRAEAQAEFERRQRAARQAEQQALEREQAEARKRYEWEVETRQRDKLIDSLEGLNRRDRHYNSWRTPTIVAPGWNYWDYRVEPRRESQEESEEEGEEVVPPLDEQYLPDEGYPVHGPGPGAYR